MLRSHLAAAAVGLGALVAVDRAEAAEVAASFTTLHAATFNISYNQAYSTNSGTGSGAFTGPSTYLSDDDYTANPFETVAGVTPGTLRWSLYSRDSVSDVVKGAFFFSNGRAASWYQATYTFDVEFNGLNGGVELWSGNDNWAWTIAAVGGTAVSLDVGDGEDGAGDIVTNGLYTITCTFTHSASFPAGGAGTYFSVISAPSTGGGGAVPGPGAALVASMGLAGLSRRRRR